MLFRSYTGLKPRRESRSLKTSNLKEEINCFERTDLNGLCPNIDLFSFIESKVIEGERGSTYGCMLVVLNSQVFLSLSLSLSLSLVTSYFLLFLFLLFYFISFLMFTSKL